MDHRDHVALIRAGVEGAGRTWADLGSGTGAFTLALADVLGPTGTIYSVDRDSDALRIQSEAMRDRFPSVALVPMVADFTTPLELPSLDGIVMANALHFVQEKGGVLDRISAGLRAGGRFVLVEYDTDHGNPWVPFPISFTSWRTMSEEAGLRDTRRLAAMPSRFLGSIYSALSVRA